MNATERDRYREQLTDWGNRVDAEQFARIEAEEERDRYREVLNEIIALDDAPPEDVAEGPGYWGVVGYLAKLAREALNGGTK